MIRHRLLRRRVAGTALTAALALALTACFGSSKGGANDNPDADVTITFWHGWSAPSEVAAIQATIDAFEKANPNIHVKAVGNITDDKINQALRAGGSSAPDVVSSFTTDNVGEFCTSHAFVDLTPFMEKSGIDPKKTFPAPQLSYTQYNGDQCTLPLLSDAYGLYYNKDMFKAAGISGPPKTMSELDADAVKLTKSSGDGYSQVGFVPDYHFYESTITHFAAQWTPTYFTSDGKSNVANDPALKSAMEWQKGLLDKLGGYSKMDNFRTSAGEEFSNNNAFMTGQVAMMIDGEWRAGMIDDSNSKVNYARRPLPGAGRPGRPVRQGLHHRDDRRDRQHQPEAERRVGVREVPDHRHQRRRELRQRDPQRAVDDRGPGVPGREPGPELPAVHQDRLRPEQHHDAGQPQRR